MKKRYLKSVVLGALGITLSTSIVGATTSLVQAAEVNSTNDVSIVVDKKTPIVQDVSEARQILYDFGYTPFELQYASNSVLIQEATNVRTRSVTSEVIKLVTKELDKRLGKRTARTLARKFGSLMHFAQAVVRVSDETDKSISGWVYRECRKMKMSRTMSRRVATVCHYIVEIFL